MKRIAIAVLCILITAAQVPLHSTGAGQIKGQDPSGRNLRTGPGRPVGLYHTPHFVSSGTQHSRQVGWDVLSRGGSAADAALASALAHIVEDIGGIVSYAGIFMMVYYEASSGRVYSLNACFKTPLEETEPLTIPRGGIPNPRGVMVPGFMAGVEAAHQRFGRLPFAEIFRPAIELAENGFPLPAWRADYFRRLWHIIGALPGGKDIFLKRPYGLFRQYEAGDIFTQPHLAETLRQVAANGAQYMYTGAWGRRMVETVRGLGGRISMRDMVAYQPVWAEPMRTTYNGYEVCALGAPSLGASMVVQSINVMECATIGAFPHCSQSAESLYRLICSERAGEFFYAPYAPEIAADFIPEGDFTYEARADKRTAQLIWDSMVSGQWWEIEEERSLYGYTRPAHSEDIIAVDAQGNVAAVCHTINTDNWGNSGIFIDGVSVPSPGSEQQPWVDKVGPGAYLPDTTNPIIRGREVITEDK